MGNGTLAINWEDVVKVVESCMPQIIFFGIVLLVAIILSVALIFMKNTKKSMKYMVRRQSWLVVLVAFVIAMNLVLLGPMSTMVSLATGNGTIEDESIAEAIALSDEIASEGIVLLKNEGQSLPLAKNTKLNVFGWSSTNPVYGGTGSGGISSNYETVSLLEGLQTAGFEVNQEIVDFYTNYRATRPTVGMWGQDWTIPEPTLAEYDSANIWDSAKNYSDTAVIVIARSGGEGADLPLNLNSGEDTFQEGGTFGSSGVRYSSNPEDLTANSYLELTTRERAMVERVTSEFSKVVVVVNAANPMELGWLDQYDSIQSAVWFAGPGQTGFTALGKILNGDVNPSGKTPDTFIYDLTQAPNYNNFGNILYENMDEFAYTSSDNVVITPGFVNYVEGIYVGYKYYETAAVESAAGNMSFDYDSIVQYPFGYGLSYTNFTQTFDRLNNSDGFITATVTVTNTGNTAGKDVVQVYYNPPYTNGGLEKAAVNLVAFAKTEILEPGASQTLEISFTQEDMASYDESGTGAYVLEQGDYEITIRSDSHTVLGTQTVNVASTIRYDESNPRSTDEVVATNQFTSAYGDTSSVTYLSRADGFANYTQATAAPSNYNMSEANKAAFINNANYDVQANNNPDDVMPTTGAKNGLQLSELRGLDYDDPMWATLLDQLSVSDMDTLIARGGYSTAPISSVGKIGTVDCDGPASINNNFTGVNSIGFPSATMMASTWNTSLVERFGESIGKMADQMGVSGWYAPAMNIHRSAFSGRNFEYYSEDGFLSGKMAAHAIIGAKNNGVYAYIKHFALNDQETNRNNMLSTWSTEQAIREVYLKPFEMAVKEGEAGAAMSAFNYIGTVWAGGYYPLMTTVLRDEWGFQGMVVTDYFANDPFMDADQAVRAGNDFCLAPYDGATNHMTDTTSATSVLAMRQASKNILYTVVNSRAYAPENLNQGMQSWQIILIVADVVVLALVIVLEVLVIRKGYNKRKRLEVADAIVSDSAEDNAAPKE